MNIVDWVIVGILALSVLFGLYRGFVASVASLGGCLVSLGLSYWLTPKVVEFLRANTSLASTLQSYTDAAVRIGDTQLAGQAVSGLSSNAIATILGRVSLPAPLDALLKSNLENEVFRTVAGIGQNVGDYVRETIVAAVMNVICFLLCFVVIMVLFHVIIVMLKTIFRFPVLKQLNSVAGGALGLLRGVFLCFIAFALLPLIQTMVPLENVGELVQASTLAPVFNSPNLILSIMNGHL